MRLILHKNSILHLGKVRDASLNTVSINDLVDLADFDHI